MANRLEVKIKWVDAETFEKEDPEIHLSGFHAILVPGGFGERGTEGKIMAAKFAENIKFHIWEFAWVCKLQYRIRQEYGWNLNAGSEEFDHEAGKRRFEPIIYHLKEWVQGNHKVSRNVEDDKGGTMRLGAYSAVLAEGSNVAKVYNSTDIEERHRHRYEVDINYRKELEKNGLIFSGMSPDGRLPEIVELSDHPWFIGVQFHPELKSKPFDPHPLFRDFIKAAKNISRLSE